MTVEIETMIGRGEFNHPVFAEFILDKYWDIKHTDPDTAKKIEEKVFSFDFLTAILAGDSRSLKGRALRRIPKGCFAGLEREIEACMADQESPWTMMAAVKLLSTLAPDRFRKKVADMVDTAMAQAPVSARSFYWLEFFHDLPDDLQRLFFNKGVALLMENPEDLSSNRHQDWVLFKSLEAALCLKDSRSAGLAVKVVGKLLDGYDPHDSNRYQFCFDLFRFLTPVPENDRIDFELDLFFHLDSGNIEEIPEFIDQFYAPAAEGLTLSGAFSNFLGETPADPVKWIASEVSGQETFLAEIFRRIVQDQRLMNGVRENGLARDMATVFLCLDWQGRRTPEFSPDQMSDTDLVDYLTLDTRYLPFMDRYISFVADMDEVRRAEVLIRAMDAGLNRWNTQGTGFYSLANILRFMGDAAEPEYLPLVLQSLRWPVEEEDAQFYEDLINGICRFGEQVFDHLDPIVDEIREDRLIDVLSVIRRIPGTRAEDFLLAHFDLFMASWKAETLDACRMLASRKGLDRVAHKVGKDQPGIDELFVIVNTFEGNKGPEIQKALEAVIFQEQQIQERLNLLDENLPRDVLRLELKCTRCGDLSYYDCRNILVSPGGEGYVAEELTCLSCGRISEFEISTDGEFAVQAEMMRVFGGHNREEDLPLPGAVKVMNSAFFGRTMPVKEGIALYREKILREPKNPDHYIGLGNAYRSVNQETLARLQYEKAIECGPFYIEAYLSLARLDEKAGAHASALDWLEKGRPFLKRPLICRGMQVPAEQIMEGYRDLHFDLVKKTGKTVGIIRASECMAGNASLKKIGPNEKCPCGSGKKYKKCCKRKH